MKIGLTIFLAWYLIGISGFVFWWTHDYDFTLNDVPLAMAAGIIGPVSFLAGYKIHGDTSKTNMIIIKKNK